MLKKAMCTLVSASILLGALFPATSVFADEAPAQETTALQSPTLAPTDDDLQGPVPEYQLPVLKESDYQSHGLTGRAGLGWIKIAVKYILKHPKQVAKTLEPYVGKRAAHTIETHFGKISKQLTPLLSWTDIPTEAVKNAVYRGLVNGGIKASTATNVANSVKTILGFLV